MFRLFLIPQSFLWLFFFFCVCVSSFWSLGRSRQALSGFGWSQLVYSRFGQIKRN
ncbi:hypothetical protein SODALDRAFT_330983 [Sodiomyces alkalinus F11]|uniref:Uncharacterized protein n=1 Tax=Sodiomyces alkalinus (strain CBS 110278 / VKM F-3762 / F11) TaxID=1314773 RepID=A0A3N2Q3E1_SODAK|nr:hypothetical protein SODALDRAFT_330983 [Sodiomyces alkalinus F11]ROT41262.1 hypothetical protein SODALDRAFT_330983 [Sodiomyces alkalinus F11]